MSVNKSELIDAIARHADISKAAAGRALDATVGAIRGSLKKGDIVTLVGFGSFYVGKRTARQGRNPRTNEPIKKAVLTVRKSGSIPPIDYLVITIERGRITAFDVGTQAPGEPELVERLAISFEKIDVSYASQSGAGAKTAGLNVT